MLTAASRLPATKMAVNLSPCLIANGSVVSDEKTYIKRVCRIVEAGFSCIQVHWPPREIQKCVSSAMHLKNLLSDSALVIVNNHVDAALASGADGVHLAGHDFPVVHARRLLGDKAIIGYTLTSWRDLHDKETLSLVNYVGIKIWSSPRSQPEGAPPWGIEGIKEALELLEVPVIVLGGITKQTQPDILPILRLRSGDGFAVVGDSWRAEDPLTLAKEMVELYHHHREGSIL